MTFTSLNSEVHCTARINADRHPDSGLAKRVDAADAASQAEYSARAAAFVQLYEADQAYKEAWEAAYERVDTL